MTNDASSTPLVHINEGQGNKKDDSKACCVVSASTKTCVWQLGGGGGGGDFVCVCVCVCMCVW